MSEDLLPENLASYSEAELLVGLEKRITELLSSRRAWLFGKLYRLDVREVHIQEVLCSNDNVPQGLARLIVNRQKERLVARQQHQSLPEDDDALAW